MKTKNMIGSDNIYAIPKSKTIRDVVSNLRRFLRSRENMEVQVFRLEDKSYLLQGRLRGGKLKQYMGLDRMISVKLMPIGEDRMMVEIGRGKWVDKITGGALACIVSKIFAVTTVFGVYKQGTLPRKVLRNIESFLAC